MRPLKRLILFLLIAPAMLLSSGSAPVAQCVGEWKELSTAGTSVEAVTLGRDLDGDCDPDEVSIRLEVIELQQEVYPGEFVTFWVFALEGQGMASAARAPSPTIRVEEGDRVKLTLLNPHYFPHTIHPHGTIHPNDMDGVPDFTQAAVKPGEAFAYEFTAKNPGTHFYHCHVQPDVHVLMGLAGMFVIEPNRPDNTFRHVVVGAGEINDMARATREEGYDREYSLVYMDVDDRLNRIAATYKDPREIEKRMHREYDSTQRTPNIFLLNGHSFPFTLRDSLIKVKENERVKMRILNAGARTMSLHTHGHHPILTHVDGYPTPREGQLIRDVFTIGPAQRIDLELRTAPDNYYASGPGVWLIHDHTEQATTNKGINPGGDITAIAYESFIGPDGLPKVATSLTRFFDPDFYRGNIPVFDPAIFHTTLENYEKGWGEQKHGAAAPPYPVREGSPAAASGDHTLEEHKIVASSCARARGFRQIRMQGGIKFAREGEVYAFEPRVIRADRCEEVEIVLELTDSVRHALMLPGLNPMFTLEFAGPQVRVARFVTPDEDVTLEFHCHVPTHKEMGMLGQLIVGKGGVPKAEAKATPEHPVGVGVVVAVDRRKSRVVLDHAEIKDFMAPMKGMSYLVTPHTLLQGVKVGDKVRFTIDPDKRAIVGIAPIRE